MSRTPISFGRNDYYTGFCKRYPEVKITPAEHYNVMKASGQIIADLLLKDGEVKMGSRLGPLLIRGFVPNGSGSRFVSTKVKESVEAGKPIYEFNDHTGGLIYRFLWNKHKCKGVTDKNMWVFKPIRSIKRRLAFLLINNMAQYPAAKPLKDEL